MHYYNYSAVHLITFAAKRREKEAERLSLYPAPVLKSKQKDLIPSTASDSETEIEHDVPFSHQLNTGSGFGTENTLPISEQNIGVTVSEEKDMQNAQQRPNSR